MLRTNRYEGRCATCAVTVPPYDGFIVSRSVGSGFRTYCVAHKAEAERQDRGSAAKVEPDAEYTEPQGEQPTSLDADAIVAKIAKLSADFATKDVQSALDQVPALVAGEFAKLAPRELSIKVGSAPKVLIKQHHKSLPTILTAVTAGVNPFLVGPAGSGKTTLAEQVATALKRKFYMAARVTSEFKLVGFIDATGNCVRTQFREAYEKGGVFLFDEIDASDPDALTAFNAGLANDFCDFPDGMVKKHKDFVAIAAGNTYGRGADRQYVGRNQLDAATLDRFTVFNVDYDEVLERALAGDDKWVDWVQRVRRAVEAEKVRHIVSPRASIYGARLLASGMSHSEVEEATVWKGLDGPTRQRVETRMVGIG
jgi:cobaltochelatase CobS